MYNGKIIEKIRRRGEKKKHLRTMLIFTGAREGVIREEQGEGGSELLEVSLFLN